MANNLIITPAAKADLDEAFDWYEEQQPGLGKRFLDSFEECAGRLSKNPEAYAVVFRSYRSALLRRFPYAVYYEHVNDRVTVQAVFHSSRHPRGWRRRLR